MLLSEERREEEGVVACVVQCALLYLIRALMGNWWGGRVWHERRGPCCAGSAGRGPLPVAL